MTYLEQWNAMPVEQAADEVLPCCGSHAWARELVARRPLSALADLLAASDTAWWSLTEKDWQEAFASHPRIGERKAAGIATASSLAWSAGEQASATQVEADVTTRLAEGNRAYEARFGRTFIVCATGKSAMEIMAILERRMHNTAGTELHEAAEQQREITHVRLQKWLAEHEARNAA